MTRRNTLQARLLGEVRFEYANEAVKPLSRKGTALLAYLCLRPEGATREDLAEILWGPGRLANLRQELYALRRLPGAEEWLLDDGDVVSVLAGSDVGRLLEGVDSTALSDMGGNLLPGLGRVDTPAFRDWLELERRRVAELVERTWREGAERLVAEGRFDEALKLLDCALQVDPLEERLVQAAMRAAYAAGNPADALRRFEAFRRNAHDEVGSEPTPETLELASRIERGEPLGGLLSFAKLDSDLKGLVQVVALAKGVLDVGLLANVVERRPLDVAADLARLERSGWLDHHLTLLPEAEQSVLGETPAVVKRLLHHRVAEALAGSATAQPATVARHLLAADRATEAAPHLLAAAERAIDLAAKDEAVTHLLRVMWAGWDAPETRLKAALLLEGCAGQLGDDALQDAALCEAEELAWKLQSDRGLADVRMRRSRTLLQRGRTGEGLESALDALEIATRLVDEQLVARARNAVGGAQFYAGDLDGAETSFAANADAADPIERYRSRNNLGSIAGIRGRPRDALRYLEEALTLGRAAGEHAGVVGTLNNVAATAERVGDYRRAVKYFKESLTLAKQSGSQANEGRVLINLAVIYSKLGEFGPAWNTAVEVEEMALELEDPRLSMFAYELKAEVASLCGDHVGSLTLVELAERQAAQIGDERKQASLAGSRFVLEARTGAESIARVVARLDEISESRWADVTPWLWLELAMLTDDPAAATDWSSRALEIAGENEHLNTVVALSLLRAGLLEDAKAAHHEAASEAYDKLTDPSDPYAESDYVQGPQKRLLIGHWDVFSGRTLGGERLTEILELVREDLTEQAAGLPKTLRASLLRQPVAWLADLRPARLTVD